MPNNKLGNISSKKALVADEEEHRFISFWKKSHRVINWASIIVFAICFLMVIFVSIVPVFSVKYKLAPSSFEQDTQNKILNDYYANADTKTNLPFANLSGVSQPINLNGEIENELSKLTGDYGVYIKKLDDGEEYDYNSEKIFTAASLSKLFLCGAYFNAAEKDPTLMIDPVAMQDQDKVDGNGSTFSDPVGSTYQPIDLIERMLKQSDNTAFAIMTRDLGINKIVDFISNNGFNETNFITNDTSPKDVGTFLEKLYNYQLMGKDYTDQMIGFMENTDFEDRLPYYLSDVKIAHKIGTWDGAYSDAGIVYGKSGDYIIVVMTDNADYTEAINAIRKLSQVTYNYFNK